MEWDQVIISKDGGAARPGDKTWTVRVNEIFRKLTTRISLSTFVIKLRQKER